MSAPQWMIDDSYGDSVHLADFCCKEANRSCRPVVVIDIEEREQIERLTKTLIEACFKHGNLTVAHNGIHGDTTETALREFANPTPPKPDEPQGLGAVVEDADGAHYVRYITGSVAPWRVVLPDNAGRPYRYYADLSVVRVLSEGWRA